MSIQDIIKNDDYYHVFQPIFGTDDLHKLGYEALIRNSNAPNPENLFNEAKKENQLFELDSCSIQKAVRTYFSVSPRKDGYLFINILPSTILQPEFPSFLKQIMSEVYIYSQYTKFPKKIVLEISESEPVLNTKYHFLKERIFLIKSFGIQIAIDDVGMGFNAIPIIIELEPNFLKLDRYFANDLFQSKQKQSIIALIKKYCDEYNCKVILEGIENELDFIVAKTIGIRYVQGYLLGRPELLKKHLIENI